MASVIQFKIDGGDHNGVGGDLVLSPDVLVYREFAAVYHGDKSTDKHQAFADLKWVRFMAEEEGPFAKYEGAEKLVNVNLECYAQANPTFDDVRVTRREKAYKKFVELEETVEGVTLGILDRRIIMVQRFMVQLDSDLSKFKSTDKDADKKLKKYMDDMTELNKSFLTLIQQKASIIKQIELQGGKKKSRNVADAITSPNESGAYSKDNLLKRRKMREENAASAPATV